MYLSITQTKGIIVKVAPGIYIDSNKIVDNYYFFSLSMPNAYIFSYDCIIFSYYIYKSSK